MFHRPSQSLSTLLLLYYLAKKEGTVLDSIKILQLIKFCSIQIERVCKWHICILTNVGNFLQSKEIYGLNIYIFLYNIEILLRLNLSIHMCKTPSWRLKPSLYPSHPTSTYIYRVTIALRVRGGFKFFQIAICSSSNHCRYYLITET